MAVDQDGVHEVEGRQHQTDIQKVRQAVPAWAQKAVQELLHRGGQAGIGVQPGLHGGIMTQRDLLRSWVDFLSPMILREVSRRDHPC